MSKITSSRAKVPHDVDTLLPALEPHASARHEVAAAPVRPPAPAGAKRLTTREALCAVVRDAMNASGVLSSGYTFKVLTLDAKTKKFAVLMNLNQEFDEGVTQQLFTEAVIKRLAEGRYKLSVGVVYWHAASAAQHRRSRPGVRVSAVAPAAVPKLPPASVAAPDKSSAISEFPETQQSVPFDSDLAQLPPLSNTQYGDL